MFLAATVIVADILCYEGAFLMVSLRFASLLFVDAKDCPNPHAIAGLTWQRCAYFGRVYELRDSVLKGPI